MAQTAQTALLEGIEMGTDETRRQVIGGQVRKLGVSLPALQAWRQKRLKTQTELAEAAGVSRATVANAERGTRIALDSAEKLARALDTTVEELRRA